VSISPELSSPSPSPSSPSLSESLLGPLPLASAFGFDLACLVLVLVLGFGFGFRLSDDDDRESMLVFLRLTLTPTLALFLRPGVVDTDTSGLPESVLLFPPVLVVRSLNLISSLVSNGICSSCGAVLLGLVLFVLLVLMFASVLGLLTEAKELVDEAGEWKFGTAKRPLEDVVVVDDTLEGERSPFEVPSPALGLTTGLAGGCNDGRRVVFNCFKLYAPFFVTILAFNVRFKIFSVRC